MVQVLCHEVRCDSGARNLTRAEQMDETKKVFFWWESARVKKFISSAGIAEIPFFPNSGSARGLGSNSGESMDVCKCIVPSRFGSILNSRKSSREVGEERWGLLITPRVFSLKIGVEPSQIVLSSAQCSNLRPTIGVKFLALCRDEFRGPRSDTARQVGSTDGRGASWPLRKELLRRTEEEKWKRKKWEEILAEPRSWHYHPSVRVGRGSNRVPTEGKEDPANPSVVFLAFYGVWQCSFFGSVGDRPPATRPEFFLRT
ncbi:hypothetical protein TNCV_4598291 [Trichonephila clavipes]|nr:hypothetical protein TNCV_4598291 [Trichonephila clavipes]